MTQADPRFSIAAAPGRVRVLFEGHEVADSRKALVFNETGRDPVVYFPREDVQMSVLKASGRTTTDASNGVATWFTIMRDAKIVEDVAWSYEAPEGEAELIENYIAFAPEHVDVESDVAVEPIRHVPPMDPPYAE